MREKAVEKRLRIKVEALGGKTLKFISPGTNGVPDRIVLLPEGKIMFVECKAPGEKPEPLQVYRMKELEKLGFKCYVVDSYETVDEFINGINVS